MNTAKPANVSEIRESINQRIVFLNLPSRVSSDSYSDPRYDTAPRLKRLAASGTERPFGVMNRRLVPV